MHLARTSPILELSAQVRVHGSDRPARRVMHRKAESQSPVSAHLSFYHYVFLLKRPLSVDNRAALCFTGVLDSLPLSCIHVSPVC